MYDHCSLVAINAYLVNWNLSLQNLRYRQGTQTCDPYTVELFPAYTFDGKLQLNLTKKKIIRENDTENTCLETGRERREEKTLCEFHISFS